MKVIYEIGKIQNHFKDGVLVIGVFDGMHLGHQALIKKAVKRAKLLKADTYVMTFSPHPVRVLHQKRRLSYIVSLPHRIKLMEDLGVKGCMMIRFTKRFAALTPEKFIKRYLVDQIKPKEVFVGDDFRFGDQRKGDIENFQMVGQKYGIKVQGVKPIKISNKKISSTNIRQLILDGKLTQVKKLLGRDFAIMGKVVRGQKRGKILGYPTANFELKHEVIPPVGVYAVSIMVGQKKYNGMANIGRRPTFNSTNMHINMETHIFNYRGNLYHKEIIVFLLKKIREERKFPSQEALLFQIQKDERKIQYYFKSLAFRS